MHLEIVHDVTYESCPEIGRGASRVSVNPSIGNTNPSSKKSWHAK